MEYTILLPLALILILGKLLGLLCKKIGIPQVIGLILAGILIGCIKYIPNQSVLNPIVLEGLSFLSKIGVILIMFSAGIETDINLIKKTCKASLLITLMGIILPLGGGFLIAGIFNGFTEEKLLSNLFYGVILTATSVSITVATLKELGKLQSKAGTSIISAAILDDIIGVIILSLILGLSKGGSSSSIGMQILMTVLFFVAAFIIGIFARKLYNWLDKNWEHHRRIPIFSFAFCFFMAYAAQKFFDVADITGAYIAGLILSSSHSKGYIDRKVDVSGYMIFTPVFFANIGITTDFSGIDLGFLAFGGCFVLMGILTKVLGCGLGSFVSKYSKRESLIVGIGMTARAEVALVCAQRGVESNIISPSIMPFIVILIVATSFLTPLLLKLLYKNEVNEPSIVNSIEND